MTATPALPSEVDVLIVGYGPVGAATAALLGRYGVRALIVDRMPEVWMAPRAIALDNEALRILQMVGLAEDAFEKVAIPKVSLHDPTLGEFARIETAGSVDGHPKLVTFFQPELERALRKLVATLPTVTAVTGVELIDFVDGDDAERGVRASLRTVATGIEQVVRARFLVAADGARSPIRQKIGLEHEGESYDEDWLVVDAFGASPDFDHVEFLCDPARPTPHMVAPGGRHRWEFMLHPGERREDMEKDEVVAKLLAPWGTPETLRIERKAVYRFQARCARSFRVGSVFLAGDAAHLTPPFVGQGLVAGLRDAANLAWKLAWVVGGKADRAILESYDRERRPHAQKMIDLARLMGQMVMPRGRARALAIHGGIQLVRKLPAFGRYIDELGIKPQNEYPEGLFARGRGVAKRGAWFPQGLVRAPSGAVMPSDEALGGKLALVGLGGAPTRSLAPAMRGAWAKAGGHFVEISPRGLGARRAGSFEDLDNRLVPGVARDGWCVVVRPDRTVMHDGPIAEADRVVRESAALLGVAC